MIQLGGLGGDPVLFEISFDDPLCEFFQQEGCIEESCVYLFEIQCQSAEFVDGGLGYGG